MSHGCAVGIAPRGANTRRIRVPAPQIAPAVTHTEPWPGRGTATKGQVQVICLFRNTAQPQQLRSAAFRAGPAICQNPNVGPSTARRLHPDLIRAGECRQFDHPLTTCVRVSAERPAMQAPDHDPRGKDTVMTHVSASEAKAMARRLRTTLSERGLDPGHSGTLELIARTLDARDWNTFVAQAASTASETDDQGIIPVLRMIDWLSTRRFYAEFLGAKIDWVDDHGDHTPRYVSITMPSGVRLRLSEHYGDGTPGSTVLILVDDVDDQLRELAAKGYGAAPAIEESHVGRSITVHDPAGNRILFVSDAGDQHRYPDELPPIVNEVILPMPPVPAFERFTSFSWWRRYGLAPDGHVSIDDGEVVFHNPDGSFSIGRVLIWEPGARYAQTFTLAQDADHPTTLTASFEAVPDGTRVRVEHGGWNAGNAARRAHFADWPMILSHLTE